MTLPASPPISLSQVCTEFGVAQTTPLGSFLRGGGIVPNTATNAGVPTALPISLGQLCGAAAYTPMVVSAPDVSGDSWPGAGIQFGSSTSSVTGGLAPFTIAWTFVSGSTFGLSSLTTANCGFIRMGNPPQGTPASGVYRVTYTDSTSATAFKDINVSDSRA